MFPCENKGMWERIFRLSVQLVDPRSLTDIRASPEIFTCFPAERTTDQRESSSHKDPDVKCIKCAINQLQLQAAKKIRN